MDKLWKDCSIQEHKEVKDIENRRNYINERFKLGKLTLSSYLSESLKLEERLNEIERKYAKD